MLDIFKGDAFSLIRMTDAVNKQPFKPGRIGAMGLFQEEGIDVLYASIEEKDGVLYLVPMKERGADPTQNKKEGRKLRMLPTVRLPVNDKLMASEVQGIRAFGSENQLETIQGKVNSKLMTMSQSIEATLEYQRVGAVKGIVYDADGSSVIHNLFTEFGITPYATVDFDLDTSANTGHIRTACHGIQRNIEDALGAAPYSYVHAFVGKTFMDKLVAHAEVQAAYERWQNGQALRESWARRIFPYAGIMFEEYRGKVGSVDFFGDEEARFFPVGAPGLFRQLFGPADYIEAANTTGRPMYAKVTPDQKGRFIDIDVESNPVTYCTRPKVLMQGTANS